MEGGVGGDGVAPLPPAGRQGKGGLVAGEVGRGVDDGGRGVGGVWTGAIVCPTGAGVGGSTAGQRLLSGSATADCTW